MKTNQIAQNIFLLLLICTTSGISFANSPTTDSPFNSVEVETALNRAKEEGKMIFLDFSAKWCTPCKWMEETTFRNQEIIDKLKEDYIAVKVDIDEPQGAVVKSQYEINYLPTMLILNSKGQLVEKVEKTLTAHDLKVLLDRHDSPRNKKVVTYKPNTSPRSVITQKQEEVEEEYTISSADYMKYKDKEEDAQNYKLQMGAYSTFQAAHDKKLYLQELFIEPILVIRDNRFEKEMFKVIMGDFQTIDEAESFQVILKNEFSLESIIK